jgi:sister-chromatid-cohesion protein PDS5
MPERNARRDAIVDVGDRDIENEFDDYESEEEYDEVDTNTALVVVSSPPVSPGPLSENTTASTPARKRKSAKPASAGATTDQAAEVGVDPEEQRSRRRRR